ncbi:MAG TPA: hypothetical protein DCF62_13820 [Porticoccaceae bacterium]|nr:hypothetical protein [Porticoccaceae bacterium]
MFIAKPLMETSTEEFRKQNAVNVDGVFFGMKAVIPEMEKPGGGAIVNIASGAGIVGFAVAGAYSSSKRAVRLITRAMALEGAQRNNNIRINSIHPGPILTPMLEQGMDDLGRQDQIRPLFESMAPVGYLGEPRDIAQGVLYLASDQSKYVTGAELVIDGGFTAQQPLSNQHLCWPRPDQLLQAIAKIIRNIYIATLNIPFTDRANFYG